MTRWFRPTTSRLVGAVLVAVLVVACQSDTESSPTGSGQATQSASASGTPVGESQSPAGESQSPAASGEAGEGEETSVFDLAVGDCFTGSVEAESVEVFDCEDPHVFEVYAVFDYEAGPDEAYPGDEEIGSVADDRCVDEFEPYIGEEYASSRWFATVIRPSEDSWRFGDREILCAVSLEDESEVTGSAEGSGE